MNMAVACCCCEDVITITLAGVAASVCPCAAGLGSNNFTAVSGIDGSFDIPFYSLNPDFGFDGEDLCVFRNGEGGSDIGMRVTHNTYSDGACTTLTNSVVLDITFIQIQLFQTSGTVYDVHISLGDDVVGLSSVRENVLLVNPAAFPGGARGVALPNATSCPMFDGGTITVESPP